MLHSHRFASCWILITAAALLGGAAGGRAQARDPKAGSDVVGSVVAPAGPVEFVDIPPADRDTIRANLERLWSIALRNPALNPPMGFDLKTSMLANGILPGPREPFIYRDTGLLYWYTFMPAYNRVRRLDVAMHGFVVTANHLSMVFADKWQADEQGVMYYEPREIRRVAGYPQYSNGMIVMSHSSRPLWTPVPRERVLRRELAVARENLVAIDKDLGAGRNKTQPPVVQERRRKERQEVEACIKYLEGELARLSPDDLKTDAAIALPGRRRLPKIGCSDVVEGGSPDAMRIVAVNSGFFDPTLPRTALQLIIVDFSNFEAASFPRSGWRRDRYGSLREGMDYGALADLLPKR